MGVQDVKKAFLDAGQGKLRCTECQLHTIQDGNNSQRLVIIGFDAAGTPFSLDSGAFDPMTNPNTEAALMAAKFLQEHT